MRRFFLLCVLFSSVGPALPVAAQALDCLGAASAALPERATVQFEGGAGIVLRGELFLPSGPGPHPAVVMLHGAGRERLNATPRFFGRRLARCGVAALVYDKRGTGASGGQWETTHFEDFVTDAVAALAFLRRHPAVGAQPVGVMGFSQGGRLATVVAARRPEVAFVVSVSAPFASVVDTRLFALEQALRRRGAAGPRLDAALTLWRRHLSALAIGDAAALAALDAELTPPRRRAARPALLPPSSYRLPRSPVYNSLAADYSEDLRRLAVPLLAIYGDRDARVPVAESIDALTRLAPYSPDVLVIPFADHSFIDRTFYRRVRVEEIIFPWIVQRLAQPQAQAPPSGPRSAAEPAATSPSRQQR